MHESEATIENINLVFVDADWAKNQNELKKQFKEKKMTEKGDKQTEGQTTCGICFDDLDYDEETEPIVILTGCEDVFHRSCVKEFFNTQIET